MTKEHLRGSKEERLRIRESLPPPATKGEILQRMRGQISGVGNVTVLLDIGLTMEEALRKHFVEICPQNLDWVLEGVKYILEEDRDDKAAHYLAEQAYWSPEESQERFQEMYDILKNIKEIRDTHLK